MTRTNEVSIKNDDDDDDDDDDVDDDADDAAAADDDDARTRRVVHKFGEILEQKNAAPSRQIRRL